jgi:hypothetical protein
MSVFDTSVSTNTTLPTWFSDAQKNIATTGKTVYDSATPFANTAGGNMSNDLYGNNQTNPFMTSINTLNTVASNAANPWMPNGQPNTQTALGGLFAAQNAKLDQILPQVAAQTGAGGIMGGNYGGLRGQTAVNTAKAGALTTLAEQQNKAALDAQNQAITAANAVGNVGSQYSTSALNTADAAMNADINQWGKYSNIVNAMGPNIDKTSTATTKGSEYDYLLKGLQAAGAAGVSIDKILSGKSGLDWLDKLIAGNGVGNITAAPSTGTSGGSVLGGTYTDPVTGETIDVGGA